MTNDTIITLTSLPTCFSFKDCESCITHEGADFEVIVDLFRNEQHKPNYNYSHFMHFSVYGVQP